MLQASKKDAMGGPVSQASKSFTEKHLFQLLALLAAESTQQCLIPQDQY